MDRRHEIFWASPAPLWAHRLENGSSEVFERPARLEFRRDEYVGELVRTLRAGTAAVADRLVAETDSGDPPRVPSEAAHLYQPMHGRYYTVSASLVCRRRGLPDRSVRVVDDERVSVVVRRLRPASPNGAIDLEDPDSYREYGWFGGRWARLSDQTTVDDVAPSAAAGLEATGGETPREKRYPMFPKSYDSDLALERSSGERRIWNALVPATEREKFLRAPIHAGEDPTDSSGSGSDETGGTSRGGEPGAESESGGAFAGDEPFWEENVDPRRNILQAEVLRPLIDLHAFADRHQSRPDEVETKDLAAPLAFAIADLWKFLDRYVTGVSTWFERTPAGTDPTGPGAEFEGARRDLLDHLYGADLEIGGVADNWLDAARAAKDRMESLRTGDWAALVSTSSVRAGDEPDLGAVQVSVEKLITGSTVDEDDESDLWETEPAHTTLYEKVARALREEQKGAGDVARELAPEFTAREEDAVFVMRCVYERPRCTPYFEPEVSSPTAPFRLASVMDVRAPARDHSFAMPDVGGPGDLRDSEKGVSVILGEKLNQQIERVKGVTMSELEDGKIGDEGPGVALVCRLSIPIISICALILLIIMVNILNFIFWWLPYFMICLPIPDSGD